jgi:hypothetical protein
MAWTQGDLEPPLTGTILDGTTPVDLTTATTVTAHIRRADGSVISRAVTLGNQTTAPGTWTLPWVAAVPPAVDDLSVAGGYAVEIEAVWVGDRPQTFAGASFQVARAIA